MEEKDDFNGLHPCIVQICLTQSDRSFDSDLEEVKDGYMSDDVVSAKTPTNADYEKSDEQIIDIDAMIVDEEEKVSAKFSDFGEDNMYSQDIEDAGAFSSQSEPDVEFVE